MAETTITGLPNATTPLSGTERVPMDQAGATKDATTQDIANLAPATDLTYTAATRTLASSTGADVTLPLVTSTTAGLAPLSGGGTSNFLRADGTWAAPAGGGAGTDLTYDAATRTLASSTGADAVLPVATTTDAGLESAADKTKLDSITVDSATLVRKFVRNASGVSIPKGSAVYQTGSSGTTLTVALADASAEATAAQTLGLAQETIANNANGYIVAVGLLDGINTSTLTEGQIVWLSETAGALTTTRPTQPAHGVVCGYCVKQAAGTAGILYVKVDNGLELNELHDVLTTGATAGVSVLGLAVDGLWKPKTLAAGDVGLGNVNNTSDANKPISTATATALAGKASTGAIGSSGLTMATARLLGRSTAATGAPEEITIGANLTLSGGTLSASVTGGGGGTVTSVGLVAPTGFSVSGSPVTTSGNITLSFAAGYSLPTTASQGNWDTAFAERTYWDGGATGLNASTGRTSLGLSALATANPATPPALGGTTPAAGAFTVLSASTEFTLPSGAPGAPTTRDLYAVADTLRYRDTGNAERLILNATDNLANLASMATARTNLGLTAIATSTPAGGLSIQSGNLVPSDVIKLVVSNKGETAVAATNYVETTVQRACTVTGAFWELAPTATGSSASQAMLYARRSGTKTSLLSANASLAAAAILTDATSLLTGTLTLAAGDSLGVDLVSVGTGSSGHIFSIVVRYS